MNLIFFIYLRSKDDLFHRNIVWVQKAFLTRVTSLSDFQAGYIFIKFERFFNIKWIPPPTALMTMKY